MLFAHSFVIAFAPHPHVRKMYTPVRAEHDFALCIKILSGREKDVATPSRAPTSRKKELPGTGVAISIRHRLMLTWKLTVL